MAGFIFRVANWFYFIWASLVAQIIKKNPPAMPEIWVPSLDWKDSPEEGMGTHSCLATSWTEEPGGLPTVHGVAEWDMTEWLSTQ